jgi:hypothetical protein
VVVYGKLGVMPLRDSCFIGESPPPLPAYWPDFPALGALEKDDDKLVDPVYVTGSAPEIIESHQTDNNFTDGNC